MGDGRAGVVGWLGPPLFFPLLAIDKWQNQHKESDRIPDTRESQHLALNSMSTFLYRCQTGYQMQENVDI
jgi:hypothetical protein